MIYAELVGNYTDRFMSGTNTDIIGMIFAAAAEPIGVGLFFTWAFMLLYTLLYMKGSSVAIPTVMSILFSGLALTYLPVNLTIYVYVLFAVSVGVIIFKAFKR